MLNQRKSSTKRDLVDHGSVARGARFVPCVTSSPDVPLVGKLGRALKIAASQMRRKIKKTEIVGVSTAGT